MNYDPWSPNPDGPQEVGKAFSAYGFYPPQTNPTGPQPLGKCYLDYLGSLPKDEQPKALARIKDALL